MKKQNKRCEIEYTQYIIGEDVIGAPKMQNNYGAI